MFKMVVLKMVVVLFDNMINRWMKILFFQSPTIIINSPKTLLHTQYWKQLSPPAIELAFVYLITYLVLSTIQENPLCERQD